MQTVTRDPNAQLHTNAISGLDYIRNFIKAWLWLFLLNPVLAQYVTLSVPWSIPPIMDAQWGVQKNQKAEFWYATYPTGFHRLDEPPEQFSAL